MLVDTINRVNKLRQKALSDPLFLQSAIEHEKAIQNMSIDYNSPQKRKTLADIYHSPSHTEQLN